MSAETPPLVLPRGLIFLASLWLIMSWTISIGLRAPVHPSSASYTPAVRTMLLCVTTGLLIGWPLLRLSQERSPYPIRQTLLDVVVLLGLAQVVIWPLRLVTSWSPMRIALLDATLIGWLLLAGAMVASGVAGNRGGPRIVAMMTCLAFCLVGPGVMWVAAVNGAPTEALSRLSPITSIRALGESGFMGSATADWLWIACVGAAAIAAWISLAMVLAIAGRRAAPSLESGAALPS
jgi:hypothetical protein